MDLPVVTSKLPDGNFSWDSLTDAARAVIGVGPRSNRFLVWLKHREERREV